MAVFPVSPSVVITPTTLQFRICRAASIVMLTIFMSMTPWAVGMLTRAVACPFCASVAMTFTDQISGQDVVVAAKLVEVPELPSEPGADLPKATFEITKVLKGKQFVAAGMQFKALLVGRYKPGKEFLVMGVDPPGIVWTTPIKASDRLIQYLIDIQKLPEAGADRLAFFQKYFEDEISSIAFDAYDEFAKAPYDDLIALKDRMDRQQLMDWVKDPEIAINRRRLYLTMLGVCGGDAEAEAMEAMIVAGGTKNLRGLDALVASYLCLRGDAGVNLIEEKFLRNPKSEFTDTIGAVSALRFHATEVEIIDREKIVAAIRSLLKRPKMADLIIPDLARWEDWSVMEELVAMFKQSDSDKRWLRVPIVSYLMACPLPEAKVHLSELEKIDPAAIQRANLFGQGFDDDEDDDVESDGENAGEDGQESATDGEAETQADAEAKKGAADGVGEAAKVLKVPVVTYKIPLKDRVNSAPAEASNISAVSEDRSDNSEKVDVAQATGTSSTSVSRVAQSGGADAGLNPPIAAMVPYLQLKIIFIPLIVSIVLFVLLWSVVSGSFQRLIF
jgi:hypothetical protein